MKMASTAGVNIPVTPDSVASPLVKNGSSFKVNTQTNHQVASPVVAENAAGQSVIVWETYTTVGAMVVTDVHGQIYDTSGAAVGGELTLSVAVAPYNPLVTMGADGTFVVAVGSAGNIYVRHFSASGSPLAAATMVGAGTPQAMASDASRGFRSHLDGNE